MEPTTLWTLDLPALSRICKFPLLLCYFARWSMTSNHKTVVLSYSSCKQKKSQFKGPPYHCIFIMYVITLIYMPLCAKISSSTHSDPTIHWSKRVMLQYLLSKPSQKDLEEQMFWGYDSSRPAIKITIALFTLALKVNGAGQGACSWLCHKFAFMIFSTQSYQIFTTTNHYRRHSAIVWH